MMMDDDNYTVVLQSLKTPANKRDPRKLRLAAVAAAMSEVVGSDSEEQMSAAKVFAATVSALEGTLKEESATLDSLSTQVALLEIFRVTVPHVSNPAILDASLPLSSRVLLGIVTSAVGIDTTTSDSKNNNDGGKKKVTLMTTTKDDLGGISAVLRAVCQAVAELIQHLSKRCDAKLLKQLYFGTLMTGLLDESRPKVRNASQAGILQVLHNTETHPIIAKSTTAYAHSRLRKVLDTLQKEEPQPEFLHFLGFLEKSMHLLDVSVLGADFMELLAVLLNQGSHNNISDFVALPKKVTTPRIFAINALLSAVTALVGSDNERQEKAISAFCPRVLATLLQSKPTVVFHEGLADLDLLHRGRTLYCDLMLACSRRIIETDPALACKLFPVVLQVIVQLCRKSEDDVDEFVTESLMTELSTVLRSHFQQLLLAPSCPTKATDKCISSSLMAMRQVLLLPFQPAWSSSLRTLVILLSMVEKHEMVPDIVKALLSLRREMAGNVASCRAIDDAVGSLIQSVGIETFWLWVDWDGKKTERGGEGIDLANSWLLPVMKTASGVAIERSPHLEFFRTQILGLARRGATMAPSAKKRGAYDAWVTGLWSLFPSFCHNPVDLNEDLEKLVPTLVKAMEDERYPQLLGMVCFGLETLSNDAKERMKMDEGTVSDESQLEAEVLAKASVALLPVLFKNVERLHGTTSAKGADTDPAMEVDNEAPTKAPVDANVVQRICSAIATLAGHAPKPFLQKLFKKVLSRLLAESQGDNSEEMKIYSLLSLSQALVASSALEESSVSLLYRTMKPMIRDDKHEAKVQKMAYRVLLEICQRYHSYVAAEETVKDLIELLTGTAVSANIPARSMRLKCIGALVKGFGSGGFSDNYLVGKVTGEVLLCLKDFKGKTRNVGYEVLISLANATGDVVDFLGIVASALASETSHMRSAAVDASSRLVFEFARQDAKMQQALPSLLQTVLILFDEQSREVIKSAVGFVRVSVAAMDPDQLRPLLPEVVGSLLKYHKGKDRFRKKIKIILKKLVRLYGYDVLVPLVPASESRLIVHMRKLEERAQRRKAANRVDAAPDNLDYDELVDSDEYDSDDGKTLMTGATGLTRKSGKTHMSGVTSQSGKTLSSRRTQGKRAGTTRLSSEKDGEVLNILSLKGKNAMYDEDSDSDSDDDGAMEFDELGKLVVFDEDDVNVQEPNFDSDVKSEGHVHVNKRRKLGNDTESTNKSVSAQSSKRNGKKVQQLGASYKSRKAGGDVKKKGQKYEPYAYVPLDGRSYSKKNRRRAVEQMATVVPQGGKRKRN